MGCVVWVPFAAVVGFFFWGLIFFTLEPPEPHHFETVEERFEENRDLLITRDDFGNVHLRPNQDLHYFNLDGELKKNPFSYDHWTMRNKRFGVRLKDFANEEGLIDEEAFKEAVIQYIYDNNLEQEYFNKENNIWYDIVSNIHTDYLGLEPRRSSKRGFWE